MIDFDNIEKRYNIPNCGGRSGKGSFPPDNNRQSLTGGNHFPSSQFPPACGSFPYRPHLSQDGACTFPPPNPEPLSHNS